MNQHVDVDDGFTHEEVVAALSDLVDEGVLDWSVDAEGNAVYWIKDDASVTNESESLASR